MFGYIFFGRIAAGSVLTLAIASSAYAQESSLTLRDALQRTLRSSPELAAYEYVIKAQDGRVLQSGLRPNPVLSGALENVLGTGEVSGFRSAEFSLSLSQLIELGGLRNKRVTVARSERDLLLSEGAIQRLDVVAETARRFVSVVSQQEMHKLTHQAVSLAEETSKAVDRRVKAAKSPVAEQERAAVALERARNDDAHAEHSLKAARFLLASSWGSTEPDFEQAAADLFELPTVGDYNALLRELEQTPDFTRYVNETRLRESEVTLAIANRNPGIEVGLGLRRLQGSRDTALMFSVGVPLPLFNRNQGAIAEAEARRDGVDANKQVALIDARTSLFGYFQEIIDRRREVEVITARTLPSAESALKSTGYAYERGRYGYIELVDAQRELLAVKRERIEAASQFHLTLIEIERLTGANVNLTENRP